MYRLYKYDIFYTSIKHRKHELHLLIVRSRIQKGKERPTITVEGPLIKHVDKKRDLVKEVTGAATKAHGLPRKIIVVVIKENPPENVSVGDQLIIDRKKTGDASR